MEARKEVTPLAELCQASETFQREYHGKNQQCYAFIELYAEIVTQVRKKIKDEGHAEKILKGLIVFELEAISAQNWYSFTITNSLYPILKNILKINSKEDIAATDKLIYLSAARKYLVEEFADQDVIKRSFWKNKEALLKEIDGILIPIIHVLMSKLTSLAEGPPSLEKLQEHFKKIVTNYAKLLSSRSTLAWLFSSSMRAEQCKFITWIDKTFDCYRTEKAEDKTKLYDLISAALVYLAMQVNNAQYVRSANGHSDFYQEILNGLNVFYLHDIDSIKKTNWLTQLILHLEKLKTTTNNEKEEIKKLTDEIRENLKILAREPRNNASSGKRAATYLEKKGYQYIVDQGSDIVKKTSGVGVISVGFFAGGPIGGFVGAVANNIIIQPLCKILTNNFLIKCKDTTFTIYEKLIQQPTATGIDALKNVYLQEKEDDVEFINLCELIKAVLELPAHLFPEKMKDKIQKTEKFVELKHKK